MFYVCDNTVAMRHTWGYWKLQMWLMWSKTEYLISFVGINLYSNVAMCVWWLLCRTPNQHRLGRYAGKQLRASLPARRPCFLAVPHGCDGHGDDLPQRSQAGWTVFRILHLKKQGVYKHLRKLFAPTESNKTRPSGKRHSSMLVCVLTCYTKETLTLSYKFAGSSSLYSRLPPFHSLILKK